MITVEQIKTIAVCGAGTMGAGIAQVIATGGYNTVLFDVQPAMLEKAKQQLLLQLDNAITKGRITAEEKEGIIQRISYTDRVEDCRGEVVIEAIVEKLDIKVALFNQLCSVNPPSTILASNTSSLPVSEIAARTDHPERVAGMHFFNPAPAMKLVEIVKGKATAAAVVELLYALSRKLGKTPVMVQDTPGFIVNRVARHYYLEAMQVAEEGVAAYKSIDRLLESAGFRMGPFTLMDLIGNDVNLAVTRSLYEAYNGAPRFAPNLLQVTKVQEGALGRKSGKGFYNYL